MEELRERTVELLASLTEEQFRRVEDYARSLRDLDAARQAYLALEELWKTRPHRPEEPSPDVQ